jgi:hypothetical protein
MSENPKEAALRSGNELRDLFMTVRTALSAAADKADAALSAIEAHIAALDEENARLHVALSTEVDSTHSNEPVHFVPGSDGSTRPNEPLSQLAPQVRYRVRRCRDGRLWYPRIVRTVQGETPEWFSQPLNPNRPV